MAHAERKPRFRRTKTRPFRLMERDLRIVKAVYDHRLLDSSHLIKLLGDGSPQQIKRRLQLLFHNRYLDRPRAQLTTYFGQPGSTKMVYALGNKGADLLASEFGISRHSIDWTAKNRSVRPLYFQHTLLVSGIMVAFEASCRDHGNVELVSWPEILERKCPESTRDRKRPQTWYIHHPSAGRMGITPDKIFGLRFLDRPEGQDVVYFFLEADRGSMPVVRRNLKATSIARKLFIYHTTYDTKIHTKQFGFKHFRVLTVTESPSRKRVDTMVEATQELDGYQGMFLFANTQTVLEGDVLACEWVSGRGEVVRLER